MAAKQVWLTCIHGVIEARKSNIDAKQMIVEKKMLPPKINILDINISRVDKITLFKTIVQAAKRDERIMAHYINVHSVNLAFSSNTFKKRLNNADVLYADGLPIVTVSKLLKRKLPERVTLTNSFYEILQMLKDDALPCFLLGGQKSVIETVAKNIKDKIGESVLAGFYCGYFDDEKRVLDKINSSSAKILFVGMGSPYQEEWVHKYKDKIYVPIIWTVGGLYDFYGGQTKIAPVRIQKIGLEWLWRLFQEPTRLWKRYLIGNPLFVYRLLKHLLKKEDKSGCNA